MEKEKNSLKIWIVIDSLLLLAIVGIFALVIAKTKAPSNGNTSLPTQSPTEPVNKPTEKPTDEPTAPPTETPTPEPTETPTPIPTDTPTPTPEVAFKPNAKVSVGNLNVRTGFGKSYDQLKIDGKEVQLHEPDELEVISKNGDWAQVKFKLNGKVYEGYVYVPYIKITDSSNIAITPTKAPTTAPSTPLVAGNYANDSTAFNEWYEIKSSGHKKMAAPNDMDIKNRFAELGAFYVDKNATDDDKVFYLTFDCGYEEDYTAKTADILDILKKHNAKAAFFVTTGFIDQATSSAKRMKEEGHIVGNHTKNHPDLSKCSVEKIQSELNDTAAYFKKKTGYDMDPYMRPPQGDFSIRSLHVTHDLGYKTIFWSLSIYDDWNMTRNDSNKQYHTTDFVKSVFKDRHHSGCIALIHAVSKENVAALDDVLTFLEEQGYRFGTLDELYY